MVSDSKADARVLGQLLVMQSVIGSLPDVTIMPFVVQGLADIPGIQSVAFHPDAGGNAHPLTRLPLRTHNASYGELRYLVTDKSAFAPYAEYLRNFAFMLALILEGRRQQKEIRRHQSTLEAHVNERTAELALSQERLALATDSGEIGVWDYDPVNNHLVWDATMYRLFGVSPEAFSGTYEAWQRTVHPEDIERAGREVKAALADGSLLQTEFRIVCPNGDIRHIQARARTLKDDAGVVTRMIGVNIDVSERREAEANLKHLIINMPIGLCMVDADGRIYLRNQRFVEMFGYDEVAVPTLTEWWLRAYPDPAYRQWVLETWNFDVAQARQAGREIVGREYRVTTQMGEERFIQIAGIMFGTNFLAVFVDNTGQRRSELALRELNFSLEAKVASRTAELAAAKDAAESANRAKSTFLANMSHELRTPLNAVIGFSHLLARSAHLDASEKNNIEIINRSGNHLLTLINDVLDLSKIDAGRVELLETEFNLPLLLNDVVAMLRPRAEQAGLTLRLEIQSLPVGIRTDALKLRQILINLLGNAIKFTQTGGVTLNVAGTPAAVGRVRLEIAVSDTGIGIAEADQQKVFEPFTQIVTHATAAGTGLGLSITRRYLTMLGGELSVTSTPGQGSTFRFSLNVPSADVGAASAAVHGMVSGLTTADRGKSILVVEDNPEARILLRALLEPLGFAVSEAQDGAAAVATVAQVGQAVPDFILMDWRMPNMDGLEATRRIRSLPLERQPKIVMLTATAFAEQRQEALDAGANDYLYKPVNEEELYAALETQLGIRFERASQKIGTASPAPTFTPVVVTPEALTGLPEKLRADLRQAVEELDIAKLKIVLPRITATHPQLAHDIAGLAAAFRYQELWILLSTPVEGRRP